MFDRRRGDGQHSSVCGICLGARRAADGQYRASRCPKTGGWISLVEIVGIPVVNDANEKIGDVDILVEPSDKVLFTVLSVGGFLGMGERLVVVPFGSLQIAGNRVMLPGGTKDALKALPEFKYATK